MNVDNLIDFLETSGQNVFIEAEGKPGVISKFIADYNIRHPNDMVSEYSRGIIILESDANKWGLELRLYFVSIEGMPPEWANKATRNFQYRGDFNYRINDNDVLYELFDAGYKLGLN